MGSMLDIRSSFDSEGYCYDSNSEYGGVATTLMTNYTSTSPHHPHHHHRPSTSSPPYRSSSPSLTNKQSLLCELQPLHPVRLPLAHHHCHCCNYRGGTFLTAPHPPPPTTTTFSAPPPPPLADSRHVIYIGSRDAVPFYYPNLATAVDMDGFKEASSSSHGPFPWGYSTTAVVHHPNPYYYPQQLYGMHNTQYGYPSTLSNANVTANTSHLPSYLMNKYYPHSVIDSSNDCGSEVYDETKSCGQADNHYQAFSTISMSTTK